MYLVALLEIIWVFFITNILGYGGGPATIPLVLHEVVYAFGWMTETEFFEMIAAANALPGPIATKMAGSVGFLVGHWLGFIVALIATVVPSLLMKIYLMNFLLKHKNSPRIKRLAAYVQPTIAVLLATILVQNFVNAAAILNGLHVVILAVGATYFLHFKKAHPSFVILGALVYGGLMGAFGLL